MKILRHLLSKKEKKKLFEELSNTYRYIMEEKNNIKRLKVERITTTDDGIELILINEFPSFFKYHNKYYPTLHLIAEIISNKSVNYVKEVFKYAVVDEGALKPLLRGADVMKPGIKETNCFKKGDTIIIFLIDKWIPIVIGEALKDYDEQQERGKVIKNLHRIGDKIWNISEKIAKQKRL